MQKSLPDRTFAIELHLNTEQQYAECRETPMSHYIFPLLKENTEHLETVHSHPSGQTQAPRVQRSVALISLLMKCFENLRILFWAVCS